MTSIFPLLEEMLKQNASDLYVTYGCPPYLRLQHKLMAVGGGTLGNQEINAMIHELADDGKREEFEKHRELNIAYALENRARFRINLFYQQQHPGMVIRRIRTEIPALDELHLPQIYQDLILEKRGLVLVVGPTGSGKSSSLAAMLGHRNKNGSGHIITIEDPIEFVHEHKNCIFTQREVGLDTESYEIALKNALRQRPDVVLIGEIRDMATMEHALTFAETGHLCVSTLHANNAYQAIERVVNFFPEEKRPQILMGLALNLKAVLSQRLIPNLHGQRSLAVEVMLNRGLIKSLIETGKIKEIQDVMSKSTHEGMCTFDQSLIALCQKNMISEEVALAEADQPANLKLLLRQSTGSASSGSSGSGSAPRQHFRI